VIRRAPFTYAAWRHPETLKLVSQVAGIELVPAYDTEIANINLAFNDTVPKEEVQEVMPDISFNWHYDSYPFVCVAMLSDCTGMIGGETVLKLPSGDEMKVRGPTRVCF
jgi:hypothetical protein